MSLRRQLLATFALQGAGAAAVLLATLWLGARLGPQAQGAFSHLKAQIEFLAAFAMLGLPQALFYFLHAGRLDAARARRWAWATALLALPIAAACGMLWLQHPPPQWLALALAVGTCVLHGQLRTQLLAGPPSAWFNLATALPQMLLLAGVLLLVAAGLAGPQGWLLLFAVAYGVAAAVAWQRLRRHPPPTSAADPAAAGDLLHYGTAAWLTAVLSTAALLGMQRLVEQWAGSAALGRFTMAATVVQGLLAPVGYAAPLLLRRWMDRPGGAAARRAAAWLFGLLLALALLVGAVAGVWPDLGLGPAYDGATRVLALLLAGGAAEAASRLLAVQASAAGLPWVAVRAEAARAAVLLLAALWAWAAGPPWPSLAGLAITWSLAAAAAALVFIGHARQAPDVGEGRHAAPPAGLRIVLLGPANSIHLQRWARAIVQRGHALCIVSQQRCDTALLPAEARVEWLPVAGPLGYFANVLFVRRVLRRWGAQLLHAHYASGYGTSAMLSGFQPTLLSVWGSDVYEFPRRGAWQAALLRRNLRRATALAATSHAMADEVRRLTPERSQIAITPFGVDLAHFAPATARRSGAPLTLGIVKTLAPTYGIDLLLRAFQGLQADPQVRAAQPALSLLIVGDGAQRAELEGLARQLGIAAQCRFVGAVPHDQVPAWLRRLDVFVAPSRAESFGVAVIEAGACGLPVVVSDAGGLPEVVRDGQTGLVVPSEDVPALQAALKQLVLDEGLRLRLGRAAREHVAREYAWEVCVDRMMACYQATLKATPKVT